MLHPHSFILIFLFFRPSNNGLKVNVLLKFQFTSNNADTIKREADSILHQKLKLNETRTYGGHWVNTDSPGGMGRTEPPCNLPRQAWRSGWSPSLCGAVLACPLGSWPVLACPRLSSGVLSWPRRSSPVLGPVLSSPPGCTDPPAEAGVPGCRGPGAAANAALVCATAGRWRLDGRWSHCPGSSRTTCRPIGITCILLKDRIPGLQQPQQTVKRICIWQGFSVLGSHVRNHTKEEAKNRKHLWSHTVSESEGASLLGYSSSVLPEAAGWLAKAGGELQGPLAAWPV